MKVTQTYILSVHHTPIIGCKNKGMQKISIWKHVQIISREQIQWLTIYYGIDEQAMKYEHHTY